MTQQLYLPPPPTSITPGMSYSQMFENGARMTRKNRLNMLAATHLSQRYGLHVGLCFGYPPLCVNQTKFELELTNKSIVPFYW